MVMKCAALCLVALALFGSFCDAQYDGVYKPSKPSPPYQKPHDQKQVSDPQQSKQSFEKPLTWKYPEDPQPEPAVEVPFELRYPVPAATVAVQCRERDARVEVKRDLFGTGQLIDPYDLTLGTCGIVSEDTAAQVLIFETELHECGSTSLIVGDSLIYTLILNYNPRPLGGSSVIRTSKAAVIVECHYPRTHNVSSLALDPLWLPFSSVKVAEEFLYFTLRLMTDDWLYVRPSYQYFLGDIINIEATVKQYFHVPLRVYVERCVATLSPDASSSPRYAFIENGCLVDAIITGSDSKFMPRQFDNVLQFQLEAFRFQDAESGLIYITCHLKATSAIYPIDAEHRACSYISGWREASGVDAACNTCSDVKGTSSGSGVIGSGGPTWVADRKSRDVSTKEEVVEWEGDVTLGPIPIAEKMIA